MLQREVSGSHIFGWMLRYGSDDVERIENVDDLYADKAFSFPA